MDKILRKKAESDSIIEDEDGVTEVGGGGGGAGDTVILSEGQPQHEEQVRKTAHIHILLLLIQKIEYKPYKVL